MSYRFSSASPNRGGGFLGFSATASGGVKATLQLPEREARGATLTFDSSSGAATAGVNLVQRGMSRRLRGSDHGGHLHVGLGSRGVVTVGGAGAAVQEFLHTGTVRGDDLAASTTLVCRNTLSLGAHINESPSTAIRMNASYSFDLAEGRVVPGRGLQMREPRARPVLQASIEGVHSEGGDTQALGIRFRHINVRQQYNVLGLGFEVGVQEKAVELCGRYSMGDGLTAELAYDPKGNRTSLALFTTM